MSNNPDLGWGTTDPYAPPPTAFEVDSSGVLAQDAAFMEDYGAIKGLIGAGSIAGAGLGSAAYYTGGWDQAQYDAQFHTALPSPGAQTPAPPYIMNTSSLRPGLQPGYENDPWADNTLRRSDSGTS